MKFWHAKRVNKVPKLCGKSCGARADKFVRHVNETLRPECAEVVRFLGRQSFLSQFLHIARY
jgi:hypothetical protein